MNFENVFAEKATSDSDDDLDVLLNCAIIIRTKTHTFDEIKQMIAKQFGDRAKITYQRVSPLRLLVSKAGEQL